MRKHKFVDKHPVLSSILICILMLLIEELIVEALKIIHTSVFKNSSDLANIVYMLISSAMVFLFYKWWFRPDFEGALTGGNLKNTLKYYIPFVIYWIISAISMIVDGTFKFKGITLPIISLSLTAGVVEEMCFRHGIVSTLLRNKNHKNQLLKVVLISAIFFGLLHASNLIRGANPLSTLFQVLTATCFGIYFSVLFIRCGNLLPAIVLHTIHDIYAVSTSGDVTVDGVISGGLVLSSYVDLACCVVLAIYAIKYLLPEQQKEKSVVLWNHKWNNNTENTIS